MTDRVADVAALSAARDRARVIAGRWQAAPAFTRLHAAFAAVDAGDAEGVATAATALLHDPRWIAPLLSPLITALRADPWFTPPLKVARSDRRTGAVLFENAAVMLVANVTRAPAPDDRPPTRITASGQLAITRFHRAGNAFLRRWTAPDDGAPATPIDCRPLRDGMVVRLDGRDQAQAIERATGAVATVSAIVRATDEMTAREYRRADGAFVRQAELDEAASRTRMLLTLLRTEQRHDAAPQFDAATRHASFHLRWSAMREWLALDARAAAPRLDEMAAADPSDEVRAAATAMRAQVAPLLTPCPA